MDHAHSPAVLRSHPLADPSRLCRHLPAQLSLFAFQDGRPVRVFRDLGHVALADVVHGMAGAAFVISRERVEAIDPSWPSAEVDGGVRVFIDPRALREVVPPPPPGSKVAVTVICHAAYLKWLRGCPESIDAQDPEPAERVLTLDGCEPQGWPAEMRGSWSRPPGHARAGPQRGAAAYAQPMAHLVRRRQRDAPGQQSTMQDWTGITSYAYDNGGRQVGVAHPIGKTLTYTFDAAGNRVVMVDPDGGLTTYSYDGQSRLTGILNPWSEMATITCDALNVSG